MAIQREHGPTPAFIPPAGITEPNLMRLGAVDAALQSEGGCPTRKGAGRAVCAHQRAEIDMRTLYALILFVISVSAASAEIRISLSRYQNDQLTVTGETQPNEAVTLDGKYKTKSDNAGRFAFHLNYKPDICMADIKAGTDVYSAVVIGCLLPIQAATPQPAPDYSKPPS